MSDSIIQHDSSINQARILNIDTSHGKIITPAFMPVGTKAAVAALTPHELLESGTQIILGGNTYHMLISPGLDVIKKIGGMHKFMAWNRPMLTDSGGFQVFSLSKNSRFCKINAEGASFKHPNNGQYIYLNAESSINAQKITGADIIMAFDYCTPDSEDKDFVKKCMGISHSWLDRSMATHKENTNSIYGYKQLFFGIVQGGYFKDLRLESTKRVLEHDIDGLAIGGETIGYDMDKTKEILEWLNPVIPKNLPCYSMGVGMRPQDLIEVVARGVDLFDCVAPTRNARHGALYSGSFSKSNGWLSFESEFNHGILNLNNSMFQFDENPIMSECECYTCQNFSRSHLRYLLKNSQLTFFTLASIHNVHVMQETCNKLRKCIVEG